QEDLEQEGFAGLARAARDFDPSLGTRFTTYAHACVEGAIWHALRVRRLRPLRQLAEGGEEGKAFEPEAGPARAPGAELDVAGLRRCLCRRDRRLAGLRSGLGRRARSAAGIARRLGGSETRVNQLLARAFRRLRRAARQEPAAPTVRPP